MATYNPNNERIKRQYFVFLKEAKRLSEDSVDAAAKALSRFENDTKFRDFKAFHFEQAVAFKRRLAEQQSQSTGDKLSKATLHATLTQLKRFFQWLAQQPGYRSRVKYSDAEYFNLSEKDTRVATAKRERKVATLEQVKHTIGTMPHGTDIELRNRAVIAFAILTGARDAALASFKLKHVDLAAGSVFQDARDVRTKFSKTFTTYFFPVGEEILTIVCDWISHLRTEKLWGDEDPLFPATRVEIGAHQQFEATGLTREFWATADPIRTIFKEAFPAAGLPYVHPHSFRTTLTRLGEKICRSPEEFKAWSQNFGHEGVLTTFIGYGSVPLGRQAELIKALAEPRAAAPYTNSAEAIAGALLAAMQERGLFGLPSRSVDSPT